MARSTSANISPEFEPPAGSVTPYDGCGMCFVGVRRLSRKTETTNSPLSQAEQVLEAVTSCGGHIIAWADDWDVSGATRSITRAGIGPWLRDEKGPYSGLAAAAVDRLGRNQRDILNTAYENHESGRKLVTYGHQGLWDLDDPIDEQRLSYESLGAQQELRNIQKRNRSNQSTTIKRGRPNGKNRYGYRYVRLHEGGRIDHVEIDKFAHGVLLHVGERILADKTGSITLSTEVVRLTRDPKTLSPGDYRSQLRGRPIKGTAWTYNVLEELMLGEGSLGYQMHKGKPILGDDGAPRRIAPALWTPAYRDALLKKCRKGSYENRAPAGDHLLSSRAECGQCEVRLSTGKTKKGILKWQCESRVRGKTDCQPAPGIYMETLDLAVEKFFLSRFGDGEEMKKVFDPGTGYAARIKELENNRTRLREDRAAGLYEDQDDKEWYQNRYKEMGAEIDKLRKLPERAPGFHLIPTGETVAKKWHSAKSNRERREMLTEFGVRVKLYPKEAPERYVITADGLSLAP
ncbi:recombinase family protein [Streptomyces albidoflavus]